MGTNNIFGGIGVNFLYQRGVCACYKKSGSAQDIKKPTISK